MPFGSEGLEEGIGLALSGGGFRATLFHLGALWRLNELGWIKLLARISSVSGGSITAGMLGLKWEKLKAANWSHDALAREVIEPLRSFCRRNVDIPSVVKGILVPWKSVSDYVTAQYSEGLFGDAKLEDLPDSPRFVFNSSNLSTGVDFRFSKPYAGDYRIGLIDRPTFKLAEAVTESSAFPPVLSPVTFDLNPDCFTKVDGADLYDDVSFRRRVTLTDRKSTRLNSSHEWISYAVFCLKKKKELPRRIQHATHNPMPLRLLGKVLFHSLKCLLSCFLSALRLR